MTKILVADDNKDYLNVMIMHLTTRGYEVEGVGSAQLALKELEEQEPGTYAVLVTDWLMPGMSGNQLIPHAKKADPDLQVIIITSHPAMGKVGVMVGNAFAYLTKPLESMSELSDTVQEACELRERLMADSGESRTPFG